MAFKNSIVSFPERGHYGNSAWRGNTTGFLVKDFLESFHSKSGGLFCDPCEGGGTSRDVAAESGIRYRGLDLHSGFNLLGDSLIEELGEPAHSVFFHPPYAGMVKYSGHCWGNEPHPDDLSNCLSINDFVEKLQLAITNIYSALEQGGTYAVLMGNWRHKGKYINLTSITERIASGTLKEEIIKIQHNCISDNKRYNSKSFIPIKHEKLLIFAKDKSVRCFIDQLILNEKRICSFFEMSWNTAIRTLFLGRKELPLSDIYSAMRPYAERKGTNRFWEAKVRQKLQDKRYFERTDRGVYRRAMYPTMV